MGLRPRLWEPPHCGVVALDLCNVDLAQYRDCRQGSQRLVCARVWVLLQEVSAPEVTETLWGRHQFLRNCFGNRPQESEGGARERAVLGAEHLLDATPDARGHAEDEAAMRNVETRRRQLPPERRLNEQQAYGLKTLRLQLHETGAGGLCLQYRRPPLGATAGPPIGCHSCPDAVS